jgi:hypothetical protein
MDSQLRAFNIRLSALEQRCMLLEANFMNHETSNEPTETEGEPSCEVTALDVPNEEEMDVFYNDSAQNKPTSVFPGPNFGTMKPGESRTKFWKRIFNFFYRLKTPENEAEFKLAWTAWKRNHPICKCRERMIVTASQ